RCAAIHDDEPRIAFCLRIEALEAQTGDVPFEVVAAKALDNPVGFVAQLLRRELCHVARIEGAAGMLLREPGDRSSAIRQVETRTQRPKLGLPQGDVCGLGIVEEGPDLLFERWRLRHGAAV